MPIDAYITLGIIVAAVILFVTEKIGVDVVGMLLIVSLVVTGILQPKEALEGFSNAATLTVAFMFVLSTAIMKTGALQYLALRLSSYFKNNIQIGIFLLMLLVALISAFINNTPVVALFIPVVIQLAQASGISSSKLLIPISFASIFGGTCTLLGTSTNLLVNGIIKDAGLPALELFTMTPLGLILLCVGILFMITIGYRLLPENRVPAENEQDRFQLRDFITEIELMENHPSVNKQILEADLVTELHMEILEVKRNGNSFTLPPGDFVLKAGDILKVNCNQEKLKNLKDKVKINSVPTVRVGDSSLLGRNTALVELIVTSDSWIEGKNLKEVDFRRRFRAAPLAIQRREEIVHEDLYEIPLRSGDVILAEVKTHFVKELRKGDSPFVIISEDKIQDFQRRDFAIAFLVFIGVIVSASMDWLDISIGAIAGSVLLVLFGQIEMKEAYKSINWKVIFLLAGALSLGAAIQKSGLDKIAAKAMVSQLMFLGPLAILSGLYLVTSLLTEMMSNNATAALMTPIALAIAQELGVSYVPFVMAVTFAASSSFMTPVGYQTNTMVYSAGNYKFKDFLRVGSFINFAFWIITSLLIPVFFPF